MTRGPGPVAAVHRILIVTALVWAFFYAGWELLQYIKTGTLLAAARAALATIAGVVIAVYLRSLRGLGAKLTPRSGV